MVLGDNHQVFDRGWLAEDIDRNQSPRPRRQSSLDLVWVDVERQRVNVGEDRRCPLIESTVCRRNKAEWRRDHLVAGLDTGRGKTEMKAARTTVDRHRLGRTRIIGHRTFEGSKLGPQAERGAIQYLEHGGDIRLGDRRTREWNLHPV